MPRVAVVITKREYEQAHRDRRTRLVDFLALLVGLLMLTGGVGAVWGIEATIPPQTDWTVQWNDVDHGGKACSAPSNPLIDCDLGQIIGQEHDRILKGETHPVTVKVPETDVNVTEVSVMVAWSDETVERSWTGQGRDAKPSGDENPESWDCMRLKVTGPTGETFTGSHCGGANQGDNGTVGGKIETKFAFAPMPNVTTVHGKRHEAERQVVLPPTKGAIGEWKFEVTLVHAGDARGNYSKLACNAEPDASCPMLKEQLNSDPSTSEGRANQGNCRVTEFLVCDGTRVDTGQEYYLHVIWTTYSLRQMV